MIPIRAVCSTHGQKLLMSLNRDTNHTQRVFHHRYEASSLTDAISENDRALLQGLIALQGSDLIQTPRRYSFSCRPCGRVLNFCVYSGIYHVVKD